MQPEVKQKIDAINEVTKPKKELTPAQQWDMLAFKVVERGLAPKGFKKITGGKFRGVEITNSDLPGLPKSRVFQVQRQAAQLVRGFREKVKKEYNDRLAKCERLEKDAINNRESCKFWQIGKRKQHQKEYEHFRNQIGIIQILINELDNVNIK